MTSSPDLISTQEACEVLSLTPSAISRMVARGEIEPLKKMPGQTGAFLFDRAEVDRVRSERATAEATASQAASA